MLWQNSLASQLPLQSLRSPRSAFRAVSTFKTYVTLAARTIDENHRYSPSVGDESLGQYIETEEDAEVASIFGDNGADGGNADMEYIDDDVNGGSVWWTGV